MLRSAGRIAAGDFPLQVVKWVRADHVRTAGEWRHRDDFAVNEFA